MRKRDFTLLYYQQLLNTLKKSGYSIVTVGQYLTGDPASKEPKVAILRHDIDRRLHKARDFADIEASHGINSTYYFRYSALEYPEVIRSVSNKGHEVGYHYETISRAAGDIILAHEYFEADMREFRTITPITTACMHGAPLSQYNNLAFWNHYDWEDFALVGEAFISISGVEYFSDTGRNWSSKHKMRDYLPGGLTREGSENIKGTEDLIRYILREEPQKLYILTHPERWSESTGEWVMMYGIDTIVNIGKKMISCIRR